MATSLPNLASDRVLQVKWMGRGFCVATAIVSQSQTLTSYTDFPSGLSERNDEHRLPW